MWVTVAVKDPPVRVKINQPADEMATPGMVAVISFVPLVLYVQRNLYVVLADSCSVALGMNCTLGRWVLLAGRVEWAYHAYGNFANYVTVFSMSMDAAGRS
jgi:hypothetical protein